MKQTKLRPILDRVIVKRLDPETKSKGGIILPDAAREKPKRGTVVSVGPGKPDDPAPGFKEGDLVLFTAYAGHDYKDSDYEVLCMNFDDILAVVENA